MSNREPDPARLAAIDQQLAAIDDRLGHSYRSIMRGDAVAVITAVVFFAAFAAGLPVYRSELLAALAMAALLAAGSFVQGLTLRAYRAEIREVRSGHLLEEDGTSE